MAASSKNYEPTPRWGCLSTLCGGQVLVWGGYSKGFGKTKNPESEKKIEIFDPFKEQWRQGTTRGDIPPVVNEGACCSSDSHLYAYGGNSATSENGCLHQLHVATLTWKELCPHQLDGPMKKNGAAMVVSDNKLVLFGGHGIPNFSSKIQSGSQFIKNDNFTDGHGKTNELHVFDLKKELWLSPKVTGDRPPPCVAFSFTLVGSSWALLFAGSNSSGRTNDVYSVDLKNMHWTKRPHPKSQSAPPAREGHSAVCLNFGSIYPKLLISGGVDSNSKVLGDMWMLDSRKWNWKEIKSSGCKPRFDHCMQAVLVCPGVTEVLMFGGCPQWPRNHHSYDDFPHVAETTIIRFESQEWTPTSVTEFSECGSDHRVKEKEGLASSATASSRAAEKVDIHPILEELDQHRERAMDLSAKLEDAQLRIGEMEILVEEEIEKRVDLGLKLEQEKERLDEALEREKRVVIEKEMVQFSLDSTVQDKKEKEKLLEELRDQVKDLQEEMAQQEETHRQQIHEKEEHVQELLDHLTEIEEQWKVDESEVTILDEPRLGGGGWGEVKVASFRGIRVAVKSLYQSIRSSYYHQLFVREMNMASRIRHPNLVQFIGACMDKEKNEGMLILMELFPTSLRKELEKRDFQMSDEVRKFITLDVARALNYLHLMRPDPFIHRDISSANVLLEPVGGKRGWRAKVTDYGSVNLQKLAKTAGPGNASYAPPETHGANAAQQSTKMDIFSFGVLILEMCTGHFPDESKRKLEIASLRDHFWGNVIARCIYENPEERPTAAVLVKDLESSLN